MNAPWHASVVQSDRALTEIPLHFIMDSSDKFGREMPFLTTYHGLSWSWGKTEKHVFFLPHLSMFSCNAANKVPLKSYSNTGHCFLFDSSGFGKGDVEHSCMDDPFERKANPRT